MSDLSEQSQPAESLKLRRADDPASTEEKRTVYLEKLKEAWSDGKVPIDKVEELTTLREQLGISLLQASQLSKKAIQSSRPGQRDDFDDELPRESSRGIALWFNTKQFYMEGFYGVVEIKLENLSDFLFDRIKVELASNLLGRAKSWSCSLGACKGVKKKFSVKPSDAGTDFIRFTLTAEQEESVYVYWGEKTFSVFEHVSDPNDVRFQAEKLINFGDNAGRAAAGDMHFHIESLLRQDKVRKANDFIDEFSKLPPNFELVELEFDEQLSDQLTEKRKKEKEGTGKPSDRIVQSDRGSLTDVASLHIQSKDRPVNILLVAKQKVTLGKHRRNDIVTRICPRSEVNDNQSNQIGRNHCRLDLTEKGVFVKDSHSVNGTLLDGKTVDANGRGIKANTKELEIGGVLKMSVGYFDDKHGLNDAAYKEVLDEPLGQMWEAAAKAGLNSITLERVSNLGADDKNGCEKYCLAYRIATIGSVPRCSLSFADKGLEPMHAAILYLGRRFYLENLSDLTDVVVNDTTLSKDELIPLSFGDHIRIARLDMRFQQQSQLFISTLVALQLNKRKGKEHDRRGSW